MNRSRIVALLNFAVWTTAFAVAFTQWPLFSENQNTKFLHGLAAAGVGTLNEDWLANTIDPLPAFSLLVQLTAQLLHPNLFYLYQALILGVYLFSLVGIANLVFDLNRTRVGAVFFMVAVIAMHSSLVVPFSLPVLGTSLGWLLQAGVANQYLFNPVFQPASFGALLVLSIYLFLRRKPFAAAATCALAGVFHSTYLPSAGVLTLAYVLITWWEDRNLLRAFSIGLVALIIALPVLIHSLFVLGPTTPETWAQAQSIIVRERIPHHSLPEIWLDRTVYVKIGIMLLALIVVRRTRLFPDSAHDVVCGHPVHAPRYPTGLRPDRVCGALAHVGLPGTAFVESADGLGHSQAVQSQCSLGEPLSGPAVDCGRGCAVSGRVPGRTGHATLICRPAFGWSKRGLCLRPVHRRAGHASI